MTETYRERCARLDSVIAEAYYAMNDALVTMNLATNSLSHYALEIRRRANGEPRWKYNDCETLTAEQCFEVFDAYEIPSWDQRSIDRTIGRLSEAHAEFEYAREQYVEASKQYEGWTRAYLVPGGHIHSSMQCSSCYPSTQYSWLTNLSGADEAEIVEYAKEIACTVCYPYAPVEEYKRLADAAKAATRCPGSGSTDWTPEPGTARWYTCYAPCPDCGTSQSVTNTGKIRAHKPA